MTRQGLRIGLLGGTFNPIHHCHLTIAHQTRKRVGLDRILFIPTGDPPHKPSDALATAGHRVEMVRLAIAAEPSFSLSEIEARHPSKSYSIETVQALRDEYGTETELFFILGLDAFLELDSWKQASQLIRLIHFIVVPRPGTVFASLHTMPLLPSIDRSSLAALDAGQKDRLDLSWTPSTNLILLRLPPCDISASVIRTRLKNGQTVSKLLPAPVESYILHHKLYTEGINRPGI